VFHAAAAVSAVESEKDPHKDFSTNVGGTYNVALYAVKCKVPVIFCSSVRVYNPDDIESCMRRYGKVPESCNLVSSAWDPQPPFANNKLMAEGILRVHGFQNGLDFIIHRMSSIVGPGQDSRQVHGWVSYLVKCAVEGIPYTIFGDGEQTRDILHVDDLVGLVKMEIEEWEKSHWQKFSGRGRALNVGGGPKLALSLFDVIKILEEQHGLHLQISFGPPRAGEPKDYVSDTTHIERWGWKRQHEDPREIIAELVNQYNK
jgi:CDP-paratose 2-epimerase